MAEISKGPTAKERQALAIVADFIVKYRYGTDWNFNANLSGVEIDWKKHPRLVRSQSWQDTDYTNNVLNFLIDLCSQDRNALRIVISAIINELDTKDIMDPYKSALVFLEILKSDGLETVLPGFSVQVFPYLEITTFPDDFYFELVNQINRGYSYGLYTAVQILIRKLFENMIIDILRKKYGVKQLDVFYYTDQGRFHDFSRLLENTVEKIKEGDFVFVKDTFNKDLIDRINTFRDNANSKAHSIIINVNKEDLDKWRSEVNEITKLLFRTISLI